MKTQKQINKERNLDFLIGCNIDYTILNSGSQINLNFRDTETVAFYPTTDKWVWRGQTFYGSAHKLWDWIGEMEERDDWADVLRKNMTK